MILGELATTGKQIRTEIKPILSTFSGEVFTPRLKTKSNFVNKYGYFVDNIGVLTSKHANFHEI